MNRTEAETFIAGLNKTEKEILLLFLTLPPEKKQEALDMAVSIVNKDAGKCEVHG